MVSIFHSLLQTFSLTCFCFVLFTLFWFLKFALFFRIYYVNKSIENIQEKRHGFRRFVWKLRKSQGFKGRRPCYCQIYDLSDCFGKFEAIFNGYYNWKTKIRLEFLVWIFGRIGKILFEWRRMSSFCSILYRSDERSPFFDTRYCFW